MDVIINVQVILLEASVRYQYFQVWVFDTWYTVCKLDIDWHYKTVFTNLLMLYYTKDTINKK